MEFRFPIPLQEQRNKTLIKQNEKKNSDWMEEIELNSKAELGRNK